MPIEIEIDGQTHMLEPVTRWKNIPLDTKPETIKVNSNYYAGSMDVIGL